MIDSRDPIVITGVGPMCPGATNAEDFARKGTRSFSRAPADAAWFEEERLLGKRGFKYMTPSTKYLLAAAAQALGDAGIGEDTYGPPERGVAVGTNFAVHRTLEAMDRTILSDGAEALQPMYAPNFSVNIPASHVSIRHRCRAFNVTLTDAVVAGIHALAFGAAALTEGRAALVIAAATEDAPPSALAPGKCGAGGGGACAMTLERLSDAQQRKARVYAKLGGCALGFLGTAGETHGRPSPVVERALQSLALTPGHSLEYLCTGAGDAVHRETDAAIREIAPRFGIDLVDLAPGCLPSCGFFSVSPLLDLATMAMRPAEALLVATSPQGHLAMLALQPAEALS